MQNKHNNNKIRVAIGNHFKNRFIERWRKEVGDIATYLNLYLNEGLIVKDPQFKAIYFPNAGVYVPLSICTFNTHDFFAQTFQYKACVKYDANFREPIKIIWYDLKEKKDCNLINDIRSVNTIRRIKFKRELDDF